MKVIFSRIARGTGGLKFAGVYIIPFPPLGGERNQRSQKRGRGGKGKEKGRIREEEGKGRRREGKEKGREGEG